MNLLSAHLTAGRDHGRLRFHPDCPLCRSQRLAGALRDPLLSTRTTAGLLAAALGAGTLLPSSVAAASDPGKPPTAKASQAPAPPPAPEAGEDASTDAPTLDETQEAPVDETPELRELLTSPDAGTDAPGEDVSEGVEESGPPPAPLEQAPVEPPVEPAPAPFEAPPSEQAPVEAAPSAPTPVPQPALPPGDQSPVAEFEQPKARHPAGPGTRRDAPQPRAEQREPSPRAVGEPEYAPQAVTESQSTLHPSPTSPTVDAATPGESAATVTASQPVPAPDSHDGSITGRFYTVRPGDSLWSIARRLLGPNASVGQIAREVNRLWELNRERIGTGNPSLIHVGTVLGLR